MPAYALESISWYTDYMRFGSPPTPFYELDAHVADEIRLIDSALQTARRRSSETR